MLEPRFYEVVYSCDDLESVLSQESAKRLRIPPGVVIRSLVLFQPEDGTVMVLLSKDATDEDWAAKEREMGVSTLPEDDGHE